MRPFFTPSTSTAGTRALAALAAGILAVTVLAASGGPAVAKPGGPRTGVGAVFMVNPVQSSGDQTLTDQRDAASAVPASAYARVPLRNLDGSGYLRGKWVVVKSATGAPAYSPQGRYFCNRRPGPVRAGDRLFLGQPDPGVPPGPRLRRSRLRAARHHQATVHRQDQPVRRRQHYQTDKPYRIRLGKGGVDDAEDAEVIVHEYGHAVHQSQVPGYGQSVDAGAIGESFGDYLAVTVGLAAADQYGWPVRAEEACPMDWDATSYTDAPHCIRRFDRDLTLDERRNQVHYDGQIWSQALWEIRLGYEDLGLTTSDWDTTYIASQFDYDRDTSFQDAARTTYQYARDRDGRAAAALVKEKFEDRGIEL